MVSSLYKQLFADVQYAYTYRRADTLIYKNLKLNGKTIGAIGIIGPCRMDYSKVLSTIDQLSEEISKLSDISALPSAKNEESDF